MRQWGPRSAKGFWQPISTAPSQHDLELQVSDGFGTYALRFPCRLTPGGWINSDTAKALTIEPVGWRMYVRRPPLTAPPQLQRPGHRTGVCPSFIGRLYLRLANAAGWSSRDSAGLSMATPPDDPIPPHGMRPMSTFDPTVPAILHERRTDRIITWTGERAGDWVRNARVPADGLVEWDGLLFDGWGNVLGG
jgi:hypothetical protein